MPVPLSRQGAASPASGRFQERLASIQIPGVPEGVGDARCAESEARVVALLVVQKLGPRLIAERNEIIVEIGVNQLLDWSLETTACRGDPGWLDLTRWSHLRGGSNNGG